MVNDSPGCDQHQKYEVKRHDRDPVYWIQEMGGMQRC